VNEAAAIEVTEGSAADLVAVEALRQSIGWAPGERYLRLALAQGAVLLVARAEGVLVGCGSGVVFGDCGFIGTMIVVEAMQRRGVGGRIFVGLLERLRAVGATRIELEATEEGRPLYEKHGFTVRWSSLVGRLTQPPLPPPADPAISAPGDAAWRDLVAIDARAYGAPRGAFLAALAAEPDCTTLVYSAGGRVVGYGMRFADRVGPLVAVSDLVAEKLGAALVGGAPEGLRLWMCGRAAAPIWRRLGFELSPNDTRMSVGTPPDDSPDHLYALIAAATG
jgi:GNAT superfamily N-acetyltransferase